MNRIRKLLIKAKIIIPKPHEKAELGQALWGRQTGSSGNVIPVSAKPKGTISARVIRKDGTIEDLGIISGGKD